MRRAGTRWNVLARRVIFWRVSAAAAGERGVAGAGDRQRDGVVHANEHARLRGKVEVLALARDDVSGAAGKAEAEATRDVTEDRTDESAATDTDGRAYDVALDVMLFLNDLTFFNFHVLAALAVGLPMRLLDGNDAHLHGDEAAVDFDGAEREVHVSLAAKHGKVAGLLLPVPDALPTRTGRGHTTSALHDRVSGTARLPRAR